MAPDSSSSEERSNTAKDLSTVPRQPSYDGQFMDQEDSSYRVGSPHTPNKATGSPESDEHEAPLFSKRVTCRLYSANPAAEQGVAGESVQYPLRPTEVVTFAGPARNHGGW